MINKISWDLLNALRSQTYIPLMNTPNYPGKGLSLSQLLFALNQELKRAAYSPSYVAKVYPLHEKYYADFVQRFSSEHISQLDLEMSTALRTIREWRNTFAHINRIPSDILSLIPTYLSSQKDRLRASFVCRHWRRALLQRAEIWSQLFLLEDETHAKTFLERAKGCTLGLTVGSEVPDDILALFSSRTERITCLSFVGREWADIERFLEINPGPLPLLHTLEISPAEEGLEDPDLPDVLPSPFFASAVNLRVFGFHPVSDWSLFLHHFFFPNLVSFDFSGTEEHPSHGLGLLDFLESSPMLRTVRMDINPYLSTITIPWDRDIILPNLEEFTLIMTDYPLDGYELAARISCPVASHTSFTYRHARDATPTDIFPDPIKWNAIVHQYTKNPVEEIVLEMRTLPVTSCQIIFRSTDKTVIDLCFEVTANPEEATPLTAVAYHRVFAEATRVIQDHPQLVDVKRLSICHDFLCNYDARIHHIADEVGPLFGSVDALGALTIYCCDLRPYLHSFTNIPVTYIRPVVFPPTEELAIVHPFGLSDDQLKTAVVGLAKSQHELGVPFERVKIQRERIPEGMEEELKLWVDSVECSYMEPPETDYD